MDDSFQTKIEDAALNAWPAPRQMIFDGWILRFAGGDSKRVNSVNIRFDSTIPFPEKIRYCEAVFNQQGLPLIFRMPAFCQSEELEAALLQAGYQRFDITFVLGCELLDDLALPEGIILREMQMAEYIRLRALITGTQLANWQIYQHILEVIVPEKVLLGLFVGDQPIACGMGVVDEDLLGFFGIYTAESKRCCGYGRAMMDGLTWWGIARGARFGYLQVESDNEPALAMYEKLGFKACYRYWFYKMTSSSRHG